MLSIPPPPPPRAVCSLAVLCSVPPQPLSTSCALRTASSPSKNRRSVTRTIAPGARASSQVFCYGVSRRSLSRRGQCGRQEHAQAVCTRQRNHKRDAAPQRKHSLRVPDARKRCPVRSSSTRLPILQERSALRLAHQRRPSTDRAGRRGEGEQPRAHCAILQHVRKHPQVCDGPAALSW